MNIVLQWSDLDIGRVFAKVAWKYKDYGENATMFAWNGEYQLYSYCKIVNNKIVFKKPYSKRNIDLGKTYSKVGDGVLASELEEVFYNKATTNKITYDDLRKIDKLLSEKLDNLSTNNKETNMAQTIEIKVNGTDIKLENATPETPKTQLEEHSKNVTIWFDQYGRISNQNNQTAKEATKELQNPTRLGHTFITYTKSKSRTTDIPTKEL